MEWNLLLYLPLSPLPSLYKSVKPKKKREKKTNNNQLPNAIVGDLDSITSQVRSHYEALGVPIVEDGDQYSTDFTKCLKFLRRWAGEIIEGRFLPSFTASASGSGSGSVSGVTSTGPTPGNENSQNSRIGSNLDILILGGLGGRVDQAFSQIHHLYYMTQRLDTESESESESESQGGRGIGKLYLISEESITFILKRGRNVIHVPGTRYQSQFDQSKPAQEAKPAQEGRQDEERTYLQENIGIIPITGPTRITTRGFEWDVTDWATEIGGQLSTSNHIRAETVEVQCDEAAVLFTVELVERLKFARR